MHRRPHDDAVVGHSPDLGHAVAVHQVNVQARLHEVLHLAGQRRGGDEAAEHASAQHLVAQLCRGLGLGVRTVEPRVEAPVHCGAVARKQHVDHPRNQRHLGGSDQRPILEQRGQVGFGDEVVGTARDE